MVDRIDNDVDYEDTCPEWITKCLEAMSKIGQTAPAPQPEAGGGDRGLIVLFGSQTGNAEEVG